MGLVREDCATSYQFTRAMQDEIALALADARAAGDRDGFFDAGNHACCAHSCLWPSE